MRLDDAQGRYIEFAKQTFPRGLRLDGLRQLGLANNLLSRYQHEHKRYPDSVGISICCSVALL